MTQELESGPTAAVSTIGVFDGVHLGHQALMRRVVERAGQLGVRSACVTFEPHPEDVLRPASEIAHLATLQDRIAIIRELGISEVVLLEFTPTMARLSPEQFMQLLLRRFRLYELWIGSDFAMGRSRAGGSDRLAEIGRENGFAVGQLPAVELCGEVISSSRIRRLLSEGLVDEAARLLGRPYLLRGRVVAGDRRGRLLGFPTANLAFGERLCVPKDGVYAVRCRISERQAYPAVANIGTRPTFGVGQRRVEIHLIDFHGDLYGQELAVEFVAHLRGERRFDAVASLVAQIEDDVRVVRAMLPGFRHPDRLTDGDVGAHYPSARGFG